MFLYISVWTGWGHSSGLDLYAYVSVCACVCEKACVCVCERLKELCLVQHSMHAHTVDQLLQRKRFAFT